MMSALVCVDARDWEAVIRGAAGYLNDGEAVVAHAVDERASRGYELALRGLLGRRRRGGAERGMDAASKEAAEGLLADAADLLGRLCPQVSVRTALLSGPPNEGLVRAAGDAGVRTILLGRGAPGSWPRATVRGVVRGWGYNPHGETDALVLEDGTGIRFPPHRAGAVREFVGEGQTVEATGSWREGGLHAYEIFDMSSGGHIEAHKPPGEEPAGAYGALRDRPRFVRCGDPAPVGVVRRAGGFPQSIRLR